MQKALLLAAFSTLALWGCQNKSERVASERQDVAEAQREANKDLAELRQDSAKERAELNQDIREKEADIREDVAEEKKDVAQAMNDGKTLAASGSLVGVVADVDGDSVEIKDDAGNNYDFKTNAQTRITQNGKAIALKELEEGATVRAAYDTMGNDKFVKEVTVTASEKTTDKLNERKD